MGTVRRSSDAGCPYQVVGQQQVAVSTRPQPGRPDKNARTTQE